MPARGSSLWQHCRLLCLEQYLLSAAAHACARALYPPLRALYNLLYILGFTRFTYSDSGRVSKADGWRRHDTRLQAPLSDDRTLRAHTPGVPPLCSTHPSPPALLTPYLDPHYLLLRITPLVSGAVTKVKMRCLF